MNRIKLQIKNRWTGSLIFEFEKENNSVKDTLLEAIESGVNLDGADLSGTNLRGANLSGANLYLADFSDADLRSVDFRRADLRRAYFRRANLNGADFYSANLYEATLDDAKDVPYIPLACPSDGAFIGWKKVQGKLVKLEIPEDALRCSATTQKCRCSKAKVLAITNPDGSDCGMTEILRPKDYNGDETLYKVGEMVFPDSFDKDRWNGCSHGIHFFINKQDAINY